MRGQLGSCANMMRFLLEIAMNVRQSGESGACSEHLDRFFASYGNTKMQKAAMKALCFVVAGDEPMRGKPEGWAAGIVWIG